jgi:type I restriction enzyme, R subunit
LSRETTVRIFDEFQQSRNLSPAGYSFTELIIDSLAKNGYLEADDLYEQSFKRMGDPGISPLPGS